MAGEAVHQTSVKRRRRALFYLYLNAVLTCYAGTGLLAMCVPRAHHAQISPQPSINLYMSDFLLLSSSAANAITAAFIVVTSVLAPVGGWMSDKRLGNYQTQVICQVRSVCTHRSDLPRVCGAGDHRGRDADHACDDTAVPGLGAGRRAGHIGVTSYSTSTHHVTTPSHAQVRLFVTAGLIIVAVGTGLVQPVQFVLVAGVSCTRHQVRFVIVHADQFDEEGEENDAERASSFSWCVSLCNAVLD